jgi:bile acid:Na+ symporter, BASS family
MTASPLVIVIVSFGLLFVATAALAQGLSSTWQSLDKPLRAHQQLNVMLLISNFIVLPAILIGLAAIIPFDKQVKMAIIALALCAGAPFIPWLVSLAHGNIAYSAAVTTLLTLATLIVMPLAMPGLLSALHTGATPSIWLVAYPMLLFILIPLVVGFLIRMRYPAHAMKLCSWLGPVSATFLLVHVTLFIAYSWQDFLSLRGNGVMAFALAFPVAGLLVGYLLSPPYVLSPVPAANPHRGSKIVSAVGVAQQNTGAAICAAIFALGKYTTAGDMILLGAILTIVIVAWVMAELGVRFEKKQKQQEPAAPPAQSAPSGQPAPAAGQ